MVNGVLTAQDGQENHKSIARADPYNAVLLTCAAIGILVPSLEGAGIDKNPANRARKYVRLPAEACSRSEYGP